MSAAAPNRVLGGAEASLAIAAVAFRRVLRGRAIIVVAAMSLLPLVFALLQKLADADPHNAWVATIESWSYLVVILAPILLGSAIGEEIEERTAAYLWSRPLPRWSIIIGKLLALVPLLWLLMGIALFGPGLVFHAGEVSAHFPRLFAALLIGVLAVAAVTAGVTTLAPRRGGILSLSYLLFIDRTLAWSNATISKVSLAGHTLALAGVHDNGEGALEAIAWLIGLSAVWIVIAVRQIRRME